MKKNRAWKSLLFKVSHLDLEYQDRQELLDQFRIDFDKLVCKEVGPDFYKSKYENSSVKDLVKSNLNSEEDINSSSSSDSNESHSEDEYDEDSSSTNAEDLNLINNKEKLIPESINKIWKKVALKTHPDRNNNNSEYTSLYISASEAYKEKEYGKLLIIALELGISIPEDDKLIPYIKENISFLEEKINNIEKLALWKWITATDDDQKNLIVKFTAEIVKKRNLAEI